MNALNRHARNRLAKTRNLDQGFSLIEVLISLTIVGISLIVLLQIFSGGLHRINVSEETYKASLFARSLETRIGRDLPLQTGLQRGKSEQGFEWVIDITYFVETNDILSEGDPGPEFPADGSFGGQLYDITIHVTWHSGIREKEFTLYSLRYKEREAL